jgi:acyl-CoA reductase-like NAD-dependent aldehyde dehydrogenase
MTFLKPRKPPKTNGKQTMKQLPIHNPATGALVAQLPTDDAASVAAKAAQARAAQPSWHALPLAQRKACIERFREAVKTQLDALAVTMTMETGKPIKMSRNELGGLLGRIDFFLKEVDALLATETVFHEGGMTEQIEHLPLGVVANISAWNYPWFVGGNVFIPALLTGNAVLYKPSEFATLTGLAIARLLHEAGVPKDVFIPLVGAGEVGAALLAQKIDGLFFTGSYATGARIAQALGPRMVKLQLELGGKDPTYVCEDADPKTAAESLADGAMYNTGQSCCSVERIYVHEKIHDAFVAAFVQAVRGFKLGDPASEDTYIGAITRAPQLDVLAAQVADAQAKGATLLTGGKRLPGPGNWFEPTVFSHVNHSMELMREESFGPIIGIQKVGGDAEAVMLMNDTRYGLTAGVYTPDETRARALLAQIKAGSVYWNCCDRVSPRLPWSGHGDSGMGLTLSTYGIQTFTRPKAWHLRQG